VDPGVTDAGIWTEYDSYVNLAASYAAAPSQSLIITHGVSGSGKSWLASRLAIRTGALQLRSDVERKRLFGYRPGTKTGCGVQDGIYTAEAGRLTYERLAELAGYVIEGGYTAVVDAAFLKRDQRTRFRLLAERLGVPFVLLDLDADEHLLRERILTRQASGTDPSEAGVEVLEFQLKLHEPLDSVERKCAITVDTSAELSIEELANRIAGKNVPPGRG
jgi:predicted kinase